MCWRWKDSMSAAEHLATKHSDATVLLSAHGSATPSASSAEPGGDCSVICSNVQESAHNHAAGIRPSQTAMDALADALNGRMPCADNLAGTVQRQSTAWQTACWRPCLHKLRRLWPHSAWWPRSSHAECTLAKCAPIFLSASSLHHQSTAWSHSEEWAVGSYRCKRPSSWQIRVQMGNVLDLVGMYLDRPELDHCLTKLLGQLWSRYRAYVQARMARGNHRPGRGQHAVIQRALAGALRLRTHSDEDLCVADASAVQRYHMRAAAEQDPARVLPVAIHLAAAVMLCDGTCSADGGSVQLIQRPRQPSADCTVQGMAALRALRDAAVHAATSGERLCACRALLRQVSSQEWQPSVHVAPVLDSVDTMFVVAQSPGRYAVVARVTATLGEWSFSIGCYMVPLELCCCKCPTQHLVEFDYDSIDRACVAGLMPQGTAGQKHSAHRGLLRESALLRCSVTWHATGRRRHATRMQTGTYG
jgi:hypothetical protein